MDHDSLIDFITLNSNTLKTISLHFGELSKLVDFAEQQKLNKSGQLSLRGPIIEDIHV